MRGTCGVVGMLLSAGVLLPAHAGQLNALSWLAGCWRNPRGEAGSGEYWQPLAGETMLGVGRTVRNGRTVEYEFLSLREDEQGRAVYTAVPSGQKETSFVALEVDDGVATFENSMHDFPQRIIYRRSNGAAMVVRIEGVRQGQRRSVEFQFVRETCTP